MEQIFSMLVPANRPPALVSLNREEQQSLFANICRELACASQWYPHDGNPIKEPQQQLLKETKLEWLLFTLTRPSRDSNDWHAQVLNGNDVLCTG